MAHSRLSFSPASGTKAEEAPLGCVAAQHQGRGLHPTLLTPVPDFIFGYYRVNAPSPEVLTARVFQIPDFQTLG